MDNRRAPHFQRFTVPFDFNGAPTISVPCGLSSDGLPLSLQLVGKHLSEPMLCRIGHAYEQATGWHNLHPPELNDKTSYLNEGSLVGCVFGDS
jgi:amidase